MTMADFRIYQGRGGSLAEPPGPPRTWQTLATDVLSAPQGYQADEGLVNAVNVALHLGQPLLLTGEPGTGKTLLAKSLAWELGLPLEVYETKSTSSATDLFYYYNALAQFHVAQVESRAVTPIPFKSPESPEQVGLRYLRFNALGAAILKACERSEVEDLIPPGFDFPAEPTRSVVLLDEIDKAPRDLPNDILSSLDAMAFTIAEMGNARVAAPKAMRPILIMTSNSEKALPDPFLRRCIFYNIAFPTGEALRRIVRSRLSPEAAPEPMVADALDLFATLRKKPGLRKKPATAEMLNWILALGHLAPAGGNLLRNGDAEAIGRTLPCLAKTEEDMALAQAVVKSWVDGLGKATA